jgi:Na+-transporting methylmalonyl-CoA/oxaloacetate decarboxylase gamma subunit
MTATLLLALAAAACWLIGSMIEENLPKKAPAAAAEPVAEPVTAAPVRRRRKAATAA